MKKLLLPLTIIFLVLVVTEGCKKKEPCDDVSCNDGGTCVNGTCQCDSLHEGTHCETDKRARFFGSFVGTQDCTSGKHLDYLTITAIQDSANQLNFRNLYGRERNVLGIMLADGTITIPVQESAFDTISGTAWIDNGTITVNFTAIHTGTADVCTWTGRW